MQCMYMYRSVLGKRPLLDNYVSCTTFQGATVAASILTYMYMYEILIPGKRPCGPNHKLCLSAHGDTTVVICTCTCVVLHVHVGMIMGSPFYDLKNPHFVGLQPPKPSQYLFPNLGEKIRKLIVYLKHRHIDIIILFYFLTYPPPPHCTCN